ncbi:MAG: OmpH family outer membrane protein [Candidatus Gastranaerophilales bacterium]|nr:OmpH family outer membrane protein [Candidatus Gastranaerophilales bacterium]MCM1073984.1 OmpH family outer membrane protein [Bacteroides sp.]
MMKKIFSLALLLAFCTPAFAVDKVAIIDVQKVVNKSAQVQALKKEQEAKSKELKQFVKKANDEVKAQTDEKKKQDLVKKYEKELAAKREANSKAYKTKLEAIDKTITATINNYAKTNGYDLVLVKGAVLYGGEDITEAVSKVVK